jgi:hypothetical protein
VPRSANYSRVVFIRVDERRLALKWTSAEPEFLPLPNSGVMLVMLAMLAGPQSMPSHPRVQSTSRP